MNEMDYSDTTVIVPTLNEEKNIGELIGLLLKYKAIRVIVADDGSRDRTKGIVKGFSRKNEGVMFLDRGNERVHGLTASVMDAAMAAKTMYVVIIDGDLQHPPEKIGEIVERLREGNGIVIGTRRKVLSEWPWDRKLMSMIATNLARLRLLRYIKDPVSGFFGADAEMFKAVIRKNGRLFEKQGYKVLFDLLKYAPSGTKTGTVMYDFGIRKGGESKISNRHVKIFLRSLFK